MALNIDGKTDIRRVYVDETEIYQLHYDGAIFWCKPFTLSIYKSTHATISVARISSQVGAPSGPINDNVVYYRDVIRISATAETGYKLVGDYPRTIVIESEADTTIYIETTLIKLKAPTIYLDRDGLAGTGSQYYGIDVLIGNPNEIQVKIVPTPDAQGHGYGAAFGDSVRTYEVNLDTDSGKDELIMAAEESNLIGYSSEDVGLKASRVKYFSLDIKCVAEGIEDSDISSLEWTCPYFEETTTTTTTTPNPASLELYNVVAKDGDWELLTIAKKYRTLRCGENEHYINKETGENVGQNVALYKYSCGANGELLSENEAIYESESKYELVKNGEENAE